MHHSVSVWRIFLTENQIVKQVNIFFSAGTTLSRASLAVQKSTSMWKHKAW